MANKLVVAACTFSFIFLIWFVITQLDLLAPIFLPSPVNVAKTFFVLIRDGYSGSSIFHHVLISLMRVMTAFVASCLIGIPIGVLMTMNRTLKAIFDPIIEFFRPIPPIALIPLFIVWFGIGETPKISVVYVSVFPVIVISTISGVRGIATTRIWAAQSLGADKKQLFRYIILPGALPEILTGMRIGLGIGWTALVASEMIAAASGIGWVSLNARRFLNTDIVIVGVIIMGAIGLILDRILRTIATHAVPWRGKT